MDTSQQTLSSTMAATDLDRLSIQHFESGGSEGPKDEITVVGSEDSRNATFAIRNEDHTLGNALRSIIIRNPDVDFCGYSIPHPSEAKIHLRIQSRGAPAIQILRKGLDDLQLAMETLLQKFNDSVEKGDYEHKPDLFI